MKKFLAVMMVLLTLALVCASLASCSSGGDIDEIDQTNETNGTNETATVNSIDFGKKYMLNEDRYYVFNEDKTGYYECYYEATEYTLSGRVKFEWREASDGAVYLLGVGVEYNNEHTKGKKITVIDEPIYFSEEFFVYSENSQYTGSSTTRYIKEGSDLSARIGN